MFLRSAGISTSAFHFFFVFDFVQKSLASRCFPKTPPGGVFCSFFFFFGVPAPPPFFLFFFLFFSPCQYVFCSGVFSILSKRAVRFFVAVFVAFAVLLFQSGFFGLNLHGTFRTDSLLRLVTTGPLVSVFDTTPLLLLADS